MRILLAMSSPEYLRFYDDTVRELARRGHEVLLAASMVREGKPVRFDVIDGTPGIAVAGLVPPRGDRWTAAAGAVRGTMDFVRYLHPDLAGAALLRARVKRQGLPSGLQALDGVRALRPATVDRLMRALAAAERAIPPAAPLVRFLEQHRPDLVLVSPLVEPASNQVDLVRAAQTLGIRTGVLVASWDNLTNKGDLKVPCGLVAVWNEAQRREAVAYHRVSPETVAVTGAQPFDRWFDRRPSRTREAFCREVGLPDDGPFVLFTGSSIFIARAEAEMPFVRQWIEALRSSPDPAVRGLRVLVRPHPYNGRAWNPDVFAGMPGVAVWPRGGYDPVDDASRAGLFDSLFHGEAVVGINTSAMIEAAIVGRPVLSIETPQFAGTQEGTLHYRYLLPAHGGFLHVAHGFDEHVAQLAAVLADPAQARRQLAQFVSSFIRPQGLETPSTPRLVAALERFGAAPAPAPLRAGIGSRLLRLVMTPLTAAEALLLSPADRRKRGAGSPPPKGGRTAARATTPASPATGPGVPRADRPAKVPTVVALAVAGPVLAAMLLVGGFVVSELSGHTPFAYGAPRNAAEAAGMGMGPEVVRFLRQGGDPLAVVEVRPDIISAAITRVTAGEAAVWSRRTRLVALVESLGGIPDAATRAHLACLAADIRVADVEQMLAPGGATCPPGDTVRTIEARAQ
jgi:hypothetical protein